jgi:two-component system CheB/CheR fusion protein
MGQIEVLTLTKTTILKPNILYVIPPELCIIATQENSLKVQDVAKESAPPLPNADFLLLELCKLKNAKVIAIILSGSGSDGTLGVKKVKESGGIAIAQLPEDALFESMPKHAIETKCVDYILAVKDIPQKLQRLHHAIKNGTYTTQELPFDSIRKILYQEKHLDLFKYKDETINRRIEKRMKILNIGSIKKYESYLKGHHEEVFFLSSEVLIGVTEFFRGKEAFDALKSVLMKKLSVLKDGSDFRVWSVACSSGEEPYSLAILIDEICFELGKSLHVRIFATDINAIALQKARDGIYSKHALAHLSEEHLSKYFKPTEDGYQIIKRLRDQIVFAYHNVLADPPFINIDLLTCRNILIYILRSIQSDLFSLFHFALNKNGLLFLGASESLQNSEKLFSTLDHKYRIYVKEEQEQIKHPIFSTKLIQHSIKKTTTKGDFRMPILNQELIEEHLKEDLFDYYKNGCLIVDREFNIIYKKGDISYLKFSDGILSLNIFDNLEKNLQYNARLLLKQVAISNKLESTKFIQIENEEFVQISAQPFYLESYKSMILINFQKIDANSLLYNGTDIPNFSENTIITALSTQLLDAREEITNVAQELTLSKQNMDLINDELQNSNEKLQSTVEELETSNEELQSSNTELLAILTSNKELQNRLSLLLDSSLDGIVGLDMDSRHTFINQKAAQLLGYSSQYLIGKDSHKLWHHTKPDGSFYPEQECPITRVLKYGEENRGEDLLWRSDGSSFPVELVRSPIKEDDKIIGALVVFHDITKQKEQERQTKHEQDLISTYLNVAGTIVLMLDKNGNITTINEAGCKILGATKEEIIGLNWFKHFISKGETLDAQEVFHSFMDKEHTEIAHHVNNIIDAEQKEHLIAWNNAPYTDEDGNIIGLIATGNDITKEEYLNTELIKTNIKYSQTFQAAQIGIAHIGCDGPWLDVNNYLCQLLGYTREEMLGLTFQDITFKDDLDLDLLKKQELLDGTSDHYQIQKRYICKDGHIIWATLSVVLISDTLKKPLYFISIIQDISQIKMLSLELESRKNELEDVVSFTPNPIMIYNENGTLLMMNQAWTELTGYTIRDIPNIQSWRTKACKENNSFEQIDMEKLFLENLPLNVGEVKILTKDNKELTWILSVSPLKNRYNEMRVVIASAMDITQLQRNEELMLLQSRQAAMGDMIGMIAHQWRQPLSVIGMVANNLKAALALQKEITVHDIEKLTSVLDEQTQYLSHTIDDFRTFFKPEKAKEKISLCKIFDKLKSMLLQTLENNNIILEFTHNCSIEIVTYPNELVQVLLNLINNAKDAIKERQIQNGKIIIDTQVDTENLTILIKDNAGGIDKSVITNLGEPYVTTKSKNGTGLGIYMSLMILGKHFHGNLTWKNCDDGSCFTIILPLQTTQDGEIQ